MWLRQRQRLRRHRPRSYFEYAYEEKNYSAAAHRAPVSPQGLKKGIASLEKELRVTPFSADPDTRMPVPTEYAQELVEYAAVPLAGKPALAVHDLGDRDVALPGEGFKCYNALLAQARAHNVKLGRVFEMSEIFHLYEYAAKGRGLGFTARHQIELPFFASDTSVVAVPAQGMEWAFGIGRLPTHALNDAEQAFWNHCVSYARRLRGV